MSFNTGKINFRAFMLNKELPEDLLGALQNRPLPDEDAIKDQSVYGWTSSRYPADRQLDEDTIKYGAYTRFSLTEASRSVPPSTLTAELMKEEQVRLNISGNEYLSRREKVEMKQEILDRLLPTMPVVYKTTSVVISANGKYLYADAMSDKQVDVFVSYARDAFGFPPIQLSPEYMFATKHKPFEQVEPCSYSSDIEAERVCHIPGMDFLTWLWYQSETNPDSIDASKEGTLGCMFEGPLKLVMEGGGAHEVTLNKGNPMMGTETHTGLKSGKKLSKATVNIVRGDVVYRFTLDDSLAVRGFKPAVPEGNLDAVSLYQDRILNTELVWDFITGLYEAFIKQRTGKSWDVDVKDIQNWVEARNESA